MRNLFVVPSIAVVSLMTTACATMDHQVARNEAAMTLADAAATPVNKQAAVGRASAAWSDRYTATNVYERSMAKETTVDGAFNLAASYQATGRADLAIPLYESVVRDGQFVWGTSSVNYRNRAAPLRHFNLADESARRLTLLRTAYRMAPAAPTYAVNTSSGAVSASDIGTPTAAVVGTPVSGRISDREAMRLDAQANGG
jgi:Tfp pilus assembly major pilin PilA